MNHILNEKNSQIRYLRETLEQYEKEVAKMETRYALPYLYTPVDTVSLFHLGPTTVEKLRNDLARNRMHVGKYRGKTGIIGCGGWDT